MIVLFINDIPRTVSEGSSIALFADDAKCYRTVRCPSDCNYLQNDLNSLYNWSVTWGLNFNLDKCVVMRTSRKRISSALSLTINPYIAGGHALEVVSSQKDLGVLVNNKLTWTSHIESIVAKANRMLGFL